MSTDTKTKGLISLNDVKASSGRSSTKVGTFVTDDDRRHDVVVTRREGSTSWATYYDVSLGGTNVATIVKRGNGRNLTWSWASGSYGGTLADNVERAIYFHLNQREYAAKRAAQTARLEKVLPYSFTDEVKAVDYALSNGSVGHFGVLAKVYDADAAGNTRYYVGFYSPTFAEAHAADIERELKDFVRSVQIYGNIDPRKVIEALAEFKPSLTADRTGAQVYLGQDDGAVQVSRSGLVVRQYWGSDREPEILAHVETVEQAVAVVRNYYLQWNVATQARALLTLLETTVPDGVVHYAVEQVKTPLATLITRAHDIDFNYGREG